MKIGDIVKYKFRYAEFVGIILEIKKEYVEVWWSSGSTGAILSEHRSELEIVSC